MDSSERPKLPSNVQTAIESSQIKIDEYFWQRLLKFQVSAAAAKVVRLGYPDLEPLPPTAKRPTALRSAIANYARNLFVAEAARYPTDERTGFHLAKLGERTVERVIGTLAALENAGQFRHRSLDYHGLSGDQLRSTADDAVRAASDGLLARMPSTSPSSSGGTTERGAPRQESSVESLSAQRKAVVKPILESKGWSELEWAVESEVAYHTAADYLGGKTRPYPSTRVKLAKSLGLTVQQLPR